jgi:hypothetical protein
MVIIWVAGDNLIGDGMVVPVCRTPKKELRRYVAIISFTVDYYRLKFNRYLLLCQANEPYLNSFTIDNIR